MSFSEDNTNEVTEIDCENTFSFFLTSLDSHVLDSIDLKSGVVSCHNALTDETAGGQNKAIEIKTNRTDFVEADLSDICDTVACHNINDRPQIADDTDGLHTVNNSNKQTNDPGYLTADEDLLNPNAVSISNLYVNDWLLNNMKTNCAGKETNEIKDASDKLEGSAVAQLDHSANRAILECWELDPMVKGDKDIVQSHSILFS